MANSCAARQLPVETHVLKACGKQRHKIENRTLGIGNHVNNCRCRNLIKVEQYPAEAAGHITKPGTPCFVGLFLSTDRLVQIDMRQRLAANHEGTGVSLQYGKQFESSTIFARCLRSALNQAPALKSVFSGSCAPANSRQIFVALLPRSMHRRIVTDPADNCVAIAFG
jgi:hypothetical protein